MKKLLDGQSRACADDMPPFFPEESWKDLAEAELWKHRALDLINCQHVDCNQFLLVGEQIRELPLPNRNTSR